MYVTTNKENRGHEFVKEQVGIWEELEWRKEMGKLFNYVLIPRK